MFTNAGRYYEVFLFWFIIEIINLMNILLICVLIHPQKSINYCFEFKTNGNNYTNTTSNLTRLKRIETKYTNTTSFIHHINEQNPP